MEEFVNWACLKARDNFTIDAIVHSEDAKYYFGREDIKKALQDQIRKSFINPGVPKLMVYGPYGSGKTQTLFYLEYYLRTSPPTSLKEKPHTIYIDIELRQNSTAVHFHSQLMEKLGKDAVNTWVQKLFDTSSNFDETLKAISKDQNIYLALKELRQKGDSSFSAWRWLTGLNLTSSELNALQLTKNLNVSKELADVLIAIGNLAKKVGEKMLFLIDELEVLQDVKVGDASESIHKYIKQLSDASNSSVGYLIGFKADIIDDAPEILRRGDIQGRVGPANYIDIPHLPAVADVQTFVKELLVTLTDEDKVKVKIEKEQLDTEFGKFPFTNTSFELLADYAAQDPVRALPRYIISAINECSIQAWDEEKKIVDDRVVDVIAPKVFA